MAGFSRRISAKLYKCRMPASSFDLPTSSSKLDERASSSALPGALN